MVVHKLSWSECSRRETKPTSTSKSRAKSHSIGADRSGVSLAENSGAFRTAV
jgi:hypothetical protein